VETAFMAPIFMFFMYLIFLLLGANLFGNLVTQQNSWIQTLLLTIIPAVLILIILMKAVEYAKKGSGVLGEAIISGAKCNRSRYWCDWFGCGGYWKKHYRPGSGFAFKN